MAATTAGALKAFIEAGGLGLSAYRDEAADKATLPYVVIHEAIAIVPDGSDGRFDKDSAHSVREDVQVSLWQRWRATSTGVVGESYTLPDALINLLDGSHLPAAPKHVWGVKFVSSRRLPEKDPNLVQHAMTFKIIRNV